MKRRPILFLVILSFSVIVIGLVSKSFADEKPTVVVVLKEINTQYWEIIEAGAEKGFKDFNINGKVIAPKDPLEENVQENILKSILKEKPDALIVAPHDPYIIPILTEYEKNNIPVLLIDTDDPWGGKTAYIGTDNVELGKKGGSLLASQLQPGDKVALLTGDINYSISENRVKGAKMSLEAAGIKIAMEKFGLPNEADPVAAAMEEVLKEHPDIKGVYTETDIKALGAFKVIEEHGLNIPVIGADGIIEMLELIESERLIGTVAQNPYDMGYLSVQNALKAIKGENVEKNIDTGVDIIIKENAKQRLEFLRKMLK